MASYVQMKSEFYSNKSMNSHLIYFLSNHLSLCLPHALLFLFIITEKLSSLWVVPEKSLLIALEFPFLGFTLFLRSNSPVLQLPADGIRLFTGVSGLLKSVGYMDHVQVEQKSSAVIFAGRYHQLN